MHEKRFHGGPERLRSSERLALLETERVVSLSLEGLTSPRVLDVGTGTGVFAEAFAGAAAAVTGIDPNPELLAAARDFVPNVTFREGVAEALPFPEHSFEVVFLGHVLHETDDPLTALREAQRVARRRVAILEWPWKRQDQGPPLEHRLRPARIRRLAGEAGFRSIERIRLASMDFYRLAVPTPADGS
jgi:ubiquinone/menaquinone biosynthesis C-methylase UbiE